MKYQVEISPRATRDAEEIYLWIRENSPLHADRWFNGLVDSIYSLERNPKRCPLAPENDAFEEEIRQLLYGRRRRYRILFAVVDDVVQVLHVRHCARKFLES